MSILISWFGFFGFTIRYENPLKPVICHHIAPIWTKLLLFFFFFIICARDATTTTELAATQIGHRHNLWFIQIRCVAETSKHPITIYTFGILWTWLTFYSWGIISFCGLLYAVSSVVPCADGRFAFIWKSISIQSQTFVLLSQEPKIPEKMIRSERHNIHFLMDVRFFASHQYIYIYIYMSWHNESSET